MGLAPGILPYQEMKSSQLCWHWHPVRQRVSLFRSVCTSLFCFKHVCPMAPGQPHCYICPLQREDGGVGGVLLHNERGVCRLIALGGLLEGACWPRSPMLTEAALAVLFSTSKALPIPSLTAARFPRQLWYQDTWAKCPDLRSRCQTLPKPK